MKTTDAPPAVLSQAQTARVVWDAFARGLRGERYPFDKQEKKTPAEGATP